MSNIPELNDKLQRLLNQELDAINAAIRGLDPKKLEGDGTELRAFFRQTHNEIKQMITTVRSRLAKCSDVEGISKVLEQCEDRLQELDEEVKSVRGAETVNEKLREALDTINQQRNELAACNSKNERLESDLARTEAERKRCADRSSEFAGERDKCIDERNDYKEKFERYRDDLESERRKLAEKDDLIGLLRNENTKLDSATKAIQEKLAKSESKLKKAKRSNQAMKNQLEEYDGVERKIIMGTSPFSIGLYSTYSTENFQEVFQNIRRQISGVCDQPTLPGQNELIARLLENLDLVDRYVITDPSKQTLREILTRLNFDNYRTKSVYYDDNRSFYNFLAAIKDEVPTIIPSDQITRLGTLYTEKTTKQAYTTLASDFNRLIGPELNQLLVDFNAYYDQENIELEKNLQDLRRNRTDYLEQKLEQDRTLKRNIEIAEKNVADLKSKGFFKRLGKNISAAEKAVADAKKAYTDALDRNREAIKNMMYGEEFIPNNFPDFDIKFLPSQRYAIMEIFDIIQTFVDETFDINCDGLSYDAAVKLIKLNAGFEFVKAPQTIPKIKTYEGRIDEMITRKTHLEAISDPTFIALQKSLEQIDDEYESVQQDYKDAADEIENIADKLKKASGMESIRLAEQLKNKKIELENLKSKITNTRLLRPDEAIQEAEDLKRKQELDEREKKLQDIKQQQAELLARIDANTSEDELKEILFGLSRIAVEESEIGKEEDPIKIREKEAKINLVKSIIDGDPRRAVAEYEQVIGQILEVQQETPEEKRRKEERMKLELAEAEKKAQSKIKVDMPPSEFVKVKETLEKEKTEIKLKYGAIEYDEACKLSGAPTRLRRGGLWG